MKFQANKHAANYWTNSIVAFSLSFGFYELSVDGPTWLTTTAFSGAFLFFTLFSIWNFQNWRLKNFLNSGTFRAELKQTIIPIVEGNYTYKNALTQLQAKNFASALEFRPRRDNLKNEIMLSIQPTEVELFIGSVKEFKVNIHFHIPDDESSTEHIAYNWDNELLDTTLEPSIE